MYRSFWKKLATSRDLLSPVWLPISKGVDFAFSEALIPAMDSPHTHFKLNDSSIIRLLKTSKTVMVHLGLFWFKTQTIQVHVIQNGSHCEQMSPEDSLTGAGFIGRILAGNFLRSTVEMKHWFLCSQILTVW